MHAISLRTFINNFKFKTIGGTIVHGIFHGALSLVNKISTTALFVFETNIVCATDLSKYRKYLTVPPILNVFELFHSNLFSAQVHNAASFISSVSFMSSVTLNPSGPWKQELLKAAQIIACQSSVSGGKQLTNTILGLEYLDLAINLYNGKFRGNHITSIFLKLLCLNLGTYVSQNTTLKVSLCILFTCYSAFCLSRKGCKLLRKAVISKELSHNQRAQLFLKSAGCFILTAAAIEPAITTGRILYPKWAEWRKIEINGDFHKELVSRHQLVNSRFQKNSKCRALIFDGFSSTWGKEWEDSPLTWLRPITEACQTRLARTNSQENFCQILNETTREFGAPLNVLVFNSHGSPSLMAIGPNYTFSGSSQEIHCLNKALDPNGQIYLAGCSTEKLAEKIAQAMPGLETTGTSTTQYHTYYRAISLNDRNGRKFHFDALTDTIQPHLARNLGPNYHTEEGLLLPETQLALLDIPCFAPGNERSFSFKKKN